MRRTRRRSRVGLGDAQCTGVRGDAASGIDDRDLPVAGVAISLEERCEARLGVVAGPQADECPASDRGIADRLDRDGADARLDPRHHRAHVEPVGLHRDAERSGVVSRNDRIGRDRTPW